MPQAPTAPQGQTPITSWDEAIQAIAKQYEVDPVLALAVAKKENAQMDPSAVGDSHLPGGSVGFFQLRPAAASDMGVNREDPVENIIGGVKYIKTLTDRYRDPQTGHADLQKVLWAYNGGMENVDKGSVSPAAQAYAADVIASLSQSARQSVQTPAGGTLRASGSALATPDKVASPPPAEHLHARVGRIVSDRVLKPLAGVVGLEPSQALPTAGAMIGGAKGMAIGAPAGPPGIFIGGLAGAATGAVGGEAIQMGLERLGSWFGLTKDAPAPTLPEAAGRLGSAAQTAMMGEALGQGGAKVLTKVAEKVAAPARSRLSLYAREALAEFPPESKAILPSEVSESRLLNIAENMAEGSIFGGGAVSKVKATRQGIATSRVGEAVESLGPAVTKRAAGQQAQAARTAAVKVFRAEEDAAWNAFRATEAQTLPAVTPNLDAFIAQQSGREAGHILPNAGAEAARRIAAMGESAGEMEAILMPARSRSLISGLSPEVQQQVMKQAGQTVPAQASSTGLTVAQFQRTVSDLGKMTRALEESARTDPSKYNAQYGLAKKVLQLARADLEESIASAPAAKAAYDHATSITRLGNERLFNEQVMKMAGEAPERLTRLLLRPDNSTMIEAVEAAVGKEAMDPLRRRAMQTLVRPDARTGEINWGQLAQRFQAMGDDTLSALFPGGHAEEIQRLSRLMLNLQRQPAGTLGKVGIFLTQWGPFAGALTGTLPPSAGLTLGAPYVMSKIMASPGGVRWLTTGLRAPLGSEQAIRAAAHLTAFLQRELPQPVPSHEPQP